MDATARHLERNAQAQQHGGTSVLFEDADGDPLTWETSRLRVSANVRLLKTAPERAPQTPVAGTGEAVLEAADEGPIGQEACSISPSSSKIRQRPYHDFTVVSGYLHLLILVIAALLLGVGVAVYHLW